MEIIRNVPLLALVILSFIAVVQNAFPRPDDSWELGPLAVINVRGASVFWYEGQNWKPVVILVLGGLTLWAVSRWRRHVADRTGRPARSFLWAFPITLAVMAVAWLVLRPRRDRSRARRARA